MSKRTIVVGAGIAGITAAFFESQKGCEVVLLESNARPGGLLKSDHVMDHYFDYGTHIYSETNIDKLDEFLFSDLDNRNCVISRKILTANYYGGQMNDKSCFVDTSVLPRAELNQGCLEFLSIDENIELESLRHFIISKFGTTFYNLIFKDVVVKYMGVGAEKLSPKAGLIFDFTRILAFDEIVTKRLSEISIYESSLGHHVRQEGLYKYYPKKGGIGTVVEYLMKKLRKSGVKFRPSTKISKVLEKNGNVSAVIADNEPITTDKLIWALPPGILAGLANLKTNSSPPLFRKTGLFDFIFDRPLNSMAVYINVYDTRLLSGRITLYQNLSKSKTFSCTVEVLTDSSFNLQSACETILDELVTMNLVHHRNNCIFMQFRDVQNGFPVLTTEFVASQKQFQSFCDSYFKNVVFIGRSSNLFFMTEILRDVYEKISNCPN